MKAHVKGALRSITVWFAAVLMAAPDVLTMVQANWPTVEPFIPKALESRVMNVIALLVLLLRIRTTTSLAVKAAGSPPDTHDDGGAGDSPPDTHDDGTAGESQ